VSYLPGKGPHETETTLNVLAGCFLGKVKWMRELSGTNFVFPIPNLGERAVASSSFLLL